MTFVAQLAATVEFLERIFAKTPLKDVSIRLWNGNMWPDEKPRAATVVLKHPGALRVMLASGTAKGLGEAYLRDDFDVEGDLEAALELAVALEERPSGWIKSLANLYQLRRLPATTRTGADRQRTTGARTGLLHSISRDRKMVSFHYDVSNQFYQLWLDREMIYSCGYFETPGTTLDTAQTAKCRHLCRKLRLKPGMRLLDLGCGWGALARYVARKHGVDVTGITLSAQQAALATQKVQEEGLTEHVKIKLCDYRELDAPEGFDAIVSVGMSEHVGRKHLVGYFQKARALLKSGGVFLNHAIGEDRRAQQFRGPSFVDAYVFPDGDIPPIPVVTQAAEKAGFEIRDIENLREHYALTLRHWVSRIEAEHEAAHALVGEFNYRLWRLYMAASAHGFAHADLAVYQTLLAKPDPAGRAHLPLTRQDWYGV